MVFLVPFTPPRMFRVLSYLCGAFRKVSFHGLLLNSSQWYAQYFWIVRPPIFLGDSLHLILPLVSSVLFLQLHVQEYFPPSTVLPTSALVIVPWIAPFPHQGPHSKGLSAPSGPWYSSLAWCTCRDPLFNPSCLKVDSETTTVTNPSEMQLHTQPDIISSFF